MSAGENAELDAVFRVQLPPRPYPGLRPFEKEEWPIFFGRERMADEVAARLLEKKLLVVHGDSGCGKSSLIRAGVLPRLEQDSARGGLRWRTCAVLPRGAPLWNIARALAGLREGPDVERRAVKFRRVLNFGNDAAPALARILGRQHPGEHVCLLIDQFEELFDHARQHGPEEARLVTAFLAGLYDAAPKGLCAVVTMRSEFLGACARYGAFADSVNDAQYLLPRMRHADLIRAIQEPATLYEGEVSRELAERLIADSGGGQDQLPLIQHGLMLLHEARLRGVSEGERWRLDLADYANPRRLEGLLSDHADAVMEAAQRAFPPPGDEPEDRLVEHMFRALTDINADGQAIRRPQTFAALAAVTGAPRERVAGVVGMFRAEGASFLKPYGSAPLGPEGLVDISHEALIRCWSKLAEPAEGWLAKEFRSGLIWRTLLVQAQSFAQNAENLLSPAMAEEQKAWLRARNAAWAERYGGDWVDVERMVAASVAAAATARERDRERLVAEEALKRHKAELETAKVRRRWLVVVALSTGVFGLISLAQYVRVIAEAARATEAAARASAETLRANVASNEVSILNEALQFQIEALRSEREQLIQANLRADQTQESAARAVREATVRASYQPGTFGQTGSTADALLASIRQTTDPIELAILMQALGQLGAPTAPGWADVVGTAVARALRPPMHPAGSVALAQALRTLAPSLPPTQAAAMLPRLLAAVRREPDSVARAALAEAALVLPTRRQPDEDSELRSNLLPVAGASPSVPLAAAVDRLNAPEAAVRTRTTQELVSALRDNALPASEQLVVAKALVEAMRPERLRPWSATGRYNLIWVLSEVPASLWRRPDWQPLATEARRNLEAIEQRVRSGETEVGADTRRVMSVLAQRLDMQRLQ